MQVSFKNIVKKYGDFTAVRDLDLTIEDGALHFLLGPSGCGKTTTLRMLAGLETATSGSIFFNDRDVTKMPAADRGIGMVFQNYALWPHMTVYKNIEYGLKLKKLSSADIKRRVDEVLDFTQLGPFVERLPGQLSGGQQQRVALARALAIRPHVLLLDEPLSNLDAKLRMEMRDNILRIHRQTKITTVYVTHDQKEALSMGTQISVMHAGDLIQSGSPRDLYNHPQTPFIAGFIGETNFIPGRVQGHDSSGDSGRKAYLVATELGLLRCDHTVQAFKAGDEVVCSIRPEAVAILWQGTAAKKLDNEVSFRIEHLTYLGESEQFQLRSQGGIPVKANFYHAPEHRFGDGDEIHCVFPPADLTVLKPQPELRPRT